MLQSRPTRVGALVLGALGLLGVTAATAAGPPVPTGPKGHKVHVLGEVPTPTAFAFHGKTAFAAGFGAEEGAEAGHGGIFVLRRSGAKLVPGSTGPVFGLAWHKGKLYSTAGPTLTVWKGWNGRSFKRHAVVWTGPKRFTGLNGIAFGPNGRIYAGVSLGDTNDHGPATTPYAYSVISLKPNGTDVRTVATGLRQPWQLHFLKGHKKPLVTVLGQDKPRDTKAPDWIVKAAPGQHYGFPKCTWEKPAKCQGRPKPFKLLPTHFSAMGIGSLGHKIYVAAFGGRKANHPGVYSMRLSGRKVKQVVKGVAPTVALGIHHRWIYFGDVTGRVYRVRP